MYRENPQGLEAIQCILDYDDETTAPAPRQRTAATIWSREYPDAILSQFLLDGIAK